MLFAIFGLDELKPIDGYIGHVCQVVVYFFNFGFGTHNEIICFVFVEFKDAVHLDFQQSQDVVACYLSDEMRFKGFQSVIHVCHSRIYIFGFFKFLIFVDTFFDKYLLKRSKK